MDLDALRFGNFAKLGEAVTDWEQLTRDLQRLHQQADKDLKSKAEKADWSGENATVSREFVGKTAEEFKDAHTQAHTIAGILADTRGELIAFRTQVNDAIDRAAKKGMTVLDMGDGTFQVTSTHRTDVAPGGGKPDVPTEQELGDARDEIGKILGRASTSDHTAALALKMIVDQPERGFSGADYDDRDSAAKAIKAADDMAKLLAKDPHDLTHTELARLNRNFEKYGKDGLFAERFAHDIGPKKVLTFYAAVASPYLGLGLDEEQRQLAKKLQKSLGITLGTATQSDSADMREWKSRMLALGPKSLGIIDASAPNGFLVMSNLMRFGDYNDQFLNDYGDKLIAFDKSHKGTHYWMNSGNNSSLNYWGKNDSGRDPMGGFLTALGHNPDASTKFFEPPRVPLPDREKGDSDGAIYDMKQVNEHLKYLLKDRDWLADDGTKHGPMPGVTALGRALQSATMGYGFDAEEMTQDAPLVPSGGDRRTSETARVMEEVTYLFGSTDGQKTLFAHPELGAGLGRMGALYADDLSHEISGFGGAEKDRDNFLSTYGDRAKFGTQGAIRFISMLGQQEESHKLMTMGEHLYTLSVLDANPPTTEASLNRGTDALHMEAMTRGMLDHSHVQQAEADFGAKSEESKESNARVADWIKFSAGTVIGSGVAAIPMPASTSLGMLIVPMATEAVGDAGDTLLGQFIDKASKPDESPPDVRAQMTSNKLFEHTSTEIGQTYHDYVKEHPEVRRKLDLRDFNRNLSTSYNALGTSVDDTQGLPPHHKE